MIAEKIKLASVLEKVEPELPKVQTLASRIAEAFVSYFKAPDMTFEQWERLERKYSPHSSHHAQIYFRDRGL